MLNVSGAFHSKYMKEIADRFENVINEKKLREASIPVISNVNAEFYTKANIKSLLVKHIYSPVRWYESINKLLDIGNIQIEQIGYGNTLKNILKNIQQEHQY